VTPRFRASRHVVFLGLLPESPEPVLVAKLPRLREDVAGITHEAEILSALHARREGGVDSIPRVLALDDSVYPLLLETALAGRPMAQSDLRRRRSECIAAVIDWLDELYALEQPARILDRRSYDELVEQPLRAFANAFEAGAVQRTLVDRTLELLDRLVAADVPLVFEHGDLSEPNLVWLEDGRLGVVDWELAVLEGLPGHDFCFSLIYAAFALARPQTRAEQVHAFDAALSTRTGWARPTLASHLQALGLDRSLDPLLLIACLARQTAALLDRIQSAPSPGEESTQAGRLSSGDLTWIEENRYFVLWGHALDHATELRDDPAALNA
jgi:aminoglycoside phosphotransferase (APT) family kinase protein